LNINDYVLFIGMDPAIIGDYFGIAVHALPADIPEENHGCWIIVGGPIPKKKPRDLAD